MGTLVLGSGSPRRYDLLNMAGFAFTTRTAAIDEYVNPDEQPQQTVCRLADEKSDAIPLNEHEVLLTADTLVVYEGHALGKPKDRHDAFAMIEKLNGQTHTVMTAVTIRDNWEKHQLMVTTEVDFHSFSKTDIHRYIERGDYQDKAGGYGIQSLGALLVEGIRGDYYNVVGLPLSRVVLELRAFGIHPEFE
ncbi:nucleoside triphosphate pyrophosphatase [Thalassobacillus sp. CUG 92003]|uniref:Maf family protein n=1 Tax=Thalassobacillus sp. CUG 92003 TaxID=2736641 RepID=UPI0015E7997C|nr:Maf family protein [Thalassobacillus sp. CUG 92003]